MPDELRKHLTQLLTEGQAHITFEDAVNNFPIDKAGIRPARSPHSAWELLEHIRIAQEDILHFSQDQASNYVPRKWPDDYWPKSAAPGNPEQWNNSAAAIQADRAAFLELINDDKRDLFQPFPWGDGQTLLRQALLIADHNAYHLGALAVMARILKTDPK